MSQCCTGPESAETCTLPGERLVTTVEQCRKCAGESRPVERQTILHHVKHDQLDRVNGQQYRFCLDPGCEVVYFGDRGTLFTTADVRELVSAKAKGDRRPICYCFGFTEGDARTQIEHTGLSMIPAQISKLIKAGMCACEVRNPAGVCCLGEVNQSVKRLLAAQAEFGGSARSS